MSDIDQIAAEYRRQILDALNIHDDMKLGYDPLFASERVDVIIKAACEKAVQDYDERICNHIIAMIERLSARERKTLRAAQASEKARSALDATRDEGFAG